MPHSPFTRFQVSSRPVLLIRAAFPLPYRGSDLGCSDLNIERFAHLANDLKTVGRSGFFKWKIQVRRANRRRMETRRRCCTDRWFFRPGELTREKGQALNLERSPPRKSEAAASLMTTRPTDSLFNKIRVSVVSYGNTLQLKTHDEPSDRPTPAFRESDPFSRVRPLFLNKQRVLGPRKKSQGTSTVPGKTVWKTVKLYLMAHGSAAAQRAKMENPFCHFFWRSIYSSQN